MLPVAVNVSLPGRIVPCSQRSPVSAGDEHLPLDNKVAVWPIRATVQAARRRKRPGRWVV